MSRAHRSRIAAAVLAAVLAAGCSLLTGPEEPDEITDLPRSLTAAEREVIGASNDFGLALLGKLSAADPDSNLFISPLSASMALGMALEGARGETFDAMRSTLAFGERDRAAINRSYRDLIELLRGLDPKVEFRIGNSVWYRDGFPVLDSYLSSTREYFDAEVAGLDFSDPASADRVNAWVDEATAGKIERVVKPAELRELVTLLVNAVYFKGDWTTQFDPAETRQAPFTLKDGSTEPISLMHRKGELPVADGEDYSAVDLPYGGEAYSMTVVLPDRDVGIDAFVERLDAAKWEEIAAALQATRGEGTERELYLPKFELEYGKQLDQALKDLGMERAFDPAAADFGRMVDLEAIRPQNVFISFVKQKSFVSVDEVGTEAAAATSVGMGVTSAPPSFRVDRPFVFAIRERLSGTVLFVGKIVSPPGG